MKMMDMQAGDVKETSADTSELNGWVNFILTPPSKKALSNLLTGIKPTTKLFLFRSLMRFMSFFISLSFS